jgi:hypothetical protein
LPEIPKAIIPKEGMMRIHKMGYPDRVGLCSKVIGPEKGQFFADAAILVDHDAGPPFLK